jgi:DNA-binding winged helix-turn-helix (wHTH) protein
MSDSSAIPNVLSWGAVVLDLDRRVLRGPAGESGLTEMEHKALVFLAAHAGETVKRETLERDVWGFRAGTRSETVPVTLRRLRARIEADPKNPQILLTKRRVGWLLMAPERTDRKPHALPRVRTPFQDRPAEISAIQGLMDDGWPVVTLVGPGGIGKTRLAVELAQRLDSVVYAALGAATSEDHVRAALMDALGANASDRETLQRALASQQPQVVVFDEAEVAREAVVQVMRWLASRVPRVLITSRRPLGLDGEAVFEVPPLSRAAAERFLTTRLQASRWRRVVDAALLTAVIETFEGIPLALEVAAARPQSLGELVQSIQACSVGLPQMDRAIERSWSGLQPSERQTLRALSLFSETASTEELVDWLGETADPVPLADVSLLSWDGGRWRVLRTTRSFVRRQPGDWEGLKNSFEQWLVRRAAGAHDPLLRASPTALRDWVALLPDMESVVLQGPPDLAAEMAAHLVPLYTVRGSNRLQDMLRVGLARGSHSLLHACASYQQIDDRGEEHLRRARACPDLTTRIQVLFIDIWRGQRPDREEVVGLVEVEPGQSMNARQAGLWGAWVHALPLGNSDQENMRISLHPFPYYLAALEDRLASLNWHAGHAAKAFVHARCALEASERGITPVERVRGRLPWVLLEGITAPESSLEACSRALEITLPVGEVHWTRLLALIRVGLLYVLDRDDEARKQLDRVPDALFEGANRAREQLTRVLLGRETELPPDLEPYRIAANLRNDLLAGVPGAAPGLRAWLDEADKPTRLFQASLVAYWSRLVPPPPRSEDPGDNAHYAMQIRYEE